MRLRTALVITVTMLLTLCASAGATPLRFTTPVKLLGGSGGEPSIATDPFGDVFVASPQGIPSGVNGESGTAMWISRNDGRSFGKALNLGSYLGGGDDDVIVANKVVYTADLEAAATDVCKSTNRGKTFESIGPLPDPNACSKVGLGQAAPSDDRPWLTGDTHGHLYLTYHEFVSAQPLAFRSDNGGNDLFSHACGPIVTDPAIEANVPQDVTGGTLVARPVVDKAGNFYILFATTTQQQNAAAAAAGQPSGTFSQLYLAVSHDHCQSFTDYTVFDGSKLGTNTVQFGDIFNDMTIDPAGNLYVIGDGFIGKKPFATTANVYMLRSTSKGKTWSKPLLIGHTNAAYMLPAAVAGPKAGDLTIGFFRTVNGVTDPNSLKGKWRYSMAESDTAAAAHPHFTDADVASTIFHTGQICNAGILCGLPGEPSDRSLLDFSSAALDKHGCTLFTFAGNTPKSEANNQTWDYVTRQTSDCA